MKNFKVLSTLTICLFIFSLGILSPFSHAKNTEPRKLNTKQTTLKSEKTKIKDREIVVKLKDPATFNIKDFKISSSFQSVKLKKKGILVIKVPESEDYNQVLAELNNEAEIDFAEPNYEYKLSVVPNDTYYNNQWYLSKINLPSTWNSYKGNSSITVAVIDSGVDKNHPDLQGRVLQGYDFVNNDTNPEDTMGHGTAVSGVIAGNTNNGLGVSGIDWNCKILPIKTDTVEGYLSVDAIVDGIYYAIDNGADVINMSFGSFSSSELMYNALAEAYDRGIVLVAAAGNESSYVSYPASYPFVISAASTNNLDTLSDFSNCGYALDISAPGENMYLLSPGDSYCSADGTSFSSPVVSGIAALLLGKNPNLSPAEVEWLIESSASMPSSYPSGGWNYELGYGRVDAYSALTSSLPLNGNDTGNSSIYAKTILPGQEYCELFEMPMDEDWFKFQVSTSYSNGNIVIDVPSTIDAYAELYKYNSSTSSLDFIKSVDAGYTGDDESISFSSSPGTYYLRVYDYYGHWSESTYGVQIKLKALNSIRANKSSVNIPASSNEALSFNAVYSDSTVEDISGSVTSISSNSNIAEAVGSTIYAKAAGTAYITFSYSGKSSRVVVYVKPELTGISSNISSVSLESGNRASIRLTAAYSNGSTGNITSLAAWSTSNGSIATVNRGSITAVSVGTAEITAVFGNSSIVIPVTVTPKLLSLTVDSTSITLETGDIYTPVITANFDNSTSVNVTDECIWSSSSTARAIVSASGTITAGAKGKVNITGTYGKKRVRVSVNVVPVLETILFKEAETTAYLGRVKRLRVYAKYVGDTREYDITRSVSTWGTSNAGVLTVSGGTITSVSVGNAEVTANYLDKTASISVNVAKELRYLSTNILPRYFTVGQNQQIIVTANFLVGESEDVTAETVWTYSNPAAAIVETVDGASFIHPLSLGTTSITATYQGKIKRFYVYVRNP